MLVAAWNQMRTNGKRQTKQLDTKACECKPGLRCGLKKRDRREHDNPTPNQQEESNESHENYEYYINAASKRGVLLATVKLDLICCRRLEEDRYTINPSIVRFH
jgi:hypothetical protein